MRWHKTWIAICAALFSLLLSGGAGADTDAPIPAGADTDAESPALLTRDTAAGMDSELSERPAQKVEADTGPSDTQAVRSAVDTAASEDTDTAAVSGRDEESAPKIPAGQMPVLELKVSPQKVAVGEVIRWSLQVKHLAAHRVHLSSGASFGDLELRDKSVSTTPAEDDWVKETLDVELLGFAPGEYEIPEQELSIVDGAGRIVKMTTPSAHVEVTSLIANEPEPGLKKDDGKTPGVPVFEEDYTLVWVLSILAGIVMVALLTLLGRYLWSKRRPKPGPPPPPPRPADEIALEKLEALERSGLVEEGRLKEYHVRLSEALREYLGNRYGFDSLEMSTHELRTALKGTHIDTWAFDEVCELLEETDLVKFAKYLPGQQGSKELLGRAVDLVKRTTPKREREDTGPSSGSGISKSLRPGATEDETQKGGTP